MEEKNMTIIRKIMVFAIIGLFIGAGVIPVSNANESYNETADLPIWEIGDSWTYELTIDGGIDGKMELDEVEFLDLTFEVKEILADEYKLDVSADIYGDVEFETDLITLSGYLQSTDLQATLYISKASLALDSVENFNIDGYVKPNRLPRVHFEMQGAVETSYDNSTLDFPIILDENWTVPEAELSIDASVDILGQTIPIDISIFLEEHNAETEGWEDVYLGGITYESVKIEQELGTDNNVWYCPGVGNIVKIEGGNIPFSWGGHGYYDISMELISTTYPEAPNIPAIPEGPSVVDAGNTSEYMSSATDPAGNDVRYIFRWGDGESSTSDFVSSGEEVAMAHQWNTGGVFNLQVRAQNVYGSVSDWSESFEVTVFNEDPVQPDTPDGPLNGAAMKTYYYSSTCTDPDGHRVKFGWDWDGDDYVDQWTSYMNSGESVSTPHVWNEKGTYNIQVKARDEHGGESGWSDSLTVSMPKLRKNHFFPNVITSFLSYRDSFVQRICNLINIISGYDSFIQTDISTEAALLNTNIFGPADFTFTPSFPEVDETVTFEASAIDTATGFYWSYTLASSMPVDMGTGETLYYSFSDPGLYEVTLEVTFSDAYPFYVTKTVPVQQQPPVACYTCDCYYPFVGQTVNFDGGCSYDPDGYITSYNWWYEVKGGSLWYEMGEGETISYSWDEAGEYSVILVVEDDEGETDEISKDITVEDIYDPWVSITSPVGGGTYSDVINIIWEWDRGNPPVQLYAMFDVYYRYEYGDWQVYVDDYDVNEENPAMISWDISDKPTGQYQIMVEWVDGPSDTTGWFYIDNTEEPCVSVLSPNGGESYAEDVLIIWSYYYPFDCLPFFDVYYQEQGSSWILLESDLEAPSTEGTTSALWETIDRYGYYKIRIDMKHCGDPPGEVVASDSSDGWFFIGSPDPPVACYECTNDSPDIGQLVSFDGGCSYDPDGGDIDEYYWYYVLEGTGIIVEMGSGETIDYSWDEAGVYLVTLEVTDDEGVKDQETKTIYVGDVSSDADLECSGSLSWSRAKAGGLVTDSFTVENVGDTGSSLDWKVESYPNWGDWTFTPSSGDGLTPEDDPVTVEVFLVVPNVEEASFTGEVLLVNEEDGSDYETISVSLTTPKYKQDGDSLLWQFLQLHPQILSLLKEILNL
jgi:hypothetical protein